MSARSGRNTVLCAGGLLAALSPTAVTMAADAETDATSQQPDIAEVVVTARRTEERLQDVPISITVFNQEQLSEHNVVSANDLVKFTPSLSSSNRFGAESASFALRGFVQEDQTSPSVAVYFADVVGPRAQGGTGGGNGAGVGAFFDLQNVQVLKGPQGTLFGRNTTGGAVLLVPTKPTSLTEGYVEGSVGNYDMRRAQGVFNAPLGDSVRMRLGVDRQVRDGYLKNQSSKGPDDFADIDYLAARASLVADLTPNLETYFIYQYSNSETNGSLPKVVIANTDENCAPTETAQGLAALYGPLICSQQLARAAAQDYGYWDVENDNTNPKLDLKQSQLINTTTWLASDLVTVKNIASYSRIQQDVSQNINGSNMVIPGPDVGIPITYVDLYQDPERHNISQQTFTEELQLQGEASSVPLKYQAGVYYEKSKPLNGYQGSYANIFLSCIDPQAQQCSDPLGFGFLINSLTKYTFENKGIYTQSTYELTDTVSLTGGLRYTVDEVKAIGASRLYVFPEPNAPFALCVTNGIPSNDPDVCAVSGSQKSKKPTWLVDLDWKPTTDLMLYGKYARGYRQGSVNASNSTIVSWEPEKLDSFEVGAKYSFRAAVSGYANLALFYNDFQDQQLQANLYPDGTDPAAAPAATIVNAGKSTIQGLELDGSFLFPHGFSLNYGYTLLDTKLKSFDAQPIPGYLPPLPTSQVGGDLALSPKHKVSLTAQYALPLDPALGDMNVSASYTYTDSQISSSTSPIGTLPSTELWNLNLNWKGIFSGPVDFGAFVTNLTNEKYPVYVGGGYGSSGFDTYILGQPRMYGAKLRFNFGA